MFAGFRKMPTFATAIERESNYTNIHLGALVQLVRIHACHAWGHGFESRTHRESSDSVRNRSFFYYRV
ncbi:protease prtH [Bacteroides sp. CAG:714]|nr:protease prtH [Bacteroides sp. CAG:714]